MHIVYQVLVQMCALETKSMLNNTMYMCVLVFAGLSFGAREFHRAVTLISEVHSIPSYTSMTTLHL